VLNYDFFMADCKVDSVAGRRVGTLAKIGAGLVFIYSGLVGLNYSTLIIRIGHAKSIVNDVRSDGELRGATSDYLERQRNMLMSSRMLVPFGEWSPYGGDCPFERRTVLREGYKPEGS
jgi:hypothetical protein